MGGGGGRDNRGVEGLWEGESCRNASLQPVQEIIIAFSITSVTAKLEHPHGPQQKQVLGFSEKKYSTAIPEKNHDYFRCNFEKQIKALSAASWFNSDSAVTSCYQRPDTLVRSLFKIFHL